MDSVTDALISEKVTYKKIETPLKYLAEKLVQRIPV